jgi:hypothetical protein
MRIDSFSCSEYTACFEHAAHLGKRFEWEVWRWEMPEDLGAIDDVEGAIWEGKAFEDVAFLKNDGAWS